MKLSAILSLSIISLVAAAPTLRRSQGGCAAKKAPTACRANLRQHDDMLYPIPSSIGSGNGNDNGVLNHLFNGNQVDISPSFSPALNPGGSGAKGDVTKAGDKTHHLPSPAPPLPATQGIGNGNGNDNGVLNNLFNGNQVDISPTFSPSLNL
ncbi:hypothetical protein ETB97_007146 [Aspergillus alliaceus]|uniref:Uncharacterized protein n=1 Tax=Petromyces alliaceus TaxID=209559 RepID=A0A8H6EAD8_PETAA|nr:hypothetical protein ETB97_007146 [Aspergillus burnettii]